MTFLSKFPAPLDNGVILAFAIGTLLWGLAALQIYPKGGKLQRQPTLRELPVLETDTTINKQVFSQRRSSVAGESITQDEISTQKEKTVHEKSEEKRKRVEELIITHLLFRNLDKQQKKEIIDAMFERDVEIGTEIIKQGDEGDFFYVVDSGEFEILVNGKKVASSSAGGSFGELALLYGQPRAATVRATAKSVVWCMDRATFRRIVVGATWNKRQRHQKFLKEVKLISSLTAEEVVKVADVLATISYKAGEVIVRQGEPGENFFIIEDGSVVVTKDTTEVGKLHKGEYFGEIALLTNGLRAATVTAITDVDCLVLDKNAFTRLLGPCVNILKRNMENYKLYENSL